MFPQYSGLPSSNVNDSLIPPSKPICSNQIENPIADSSTEIFYLPKSKWNRQVKFGKDTNESRNDNSYNSTPVHRTDMPALISKSAENQENVSSSALRKDTEGKFGLVNLGNTCYMNSVLQALFMTKTFRNDVLLHNRIFSKLFLKFQDLFAMQLSIPNLSEKLSVQTLLDNYLQPEQLMGDNRYRCELCNVLTDGERRAKILIAPAILILTLKHFRYDPASHQLTKLLQSVTLDEHLILETRYELYAAVVHCGSSLDSGHYYTLAKDQQMVWYKYNDSNVSKATQENLSCLKPTETPYILFYSRENLSDVENLPASILSQRLQILLSGDNSKSENFEEFRPLKIIGTRQDSDDEPLPTGCGEGGFSTS